METMLRSALAVLVLSTVASAAFAETKLVVGTVPNGGDGPLLCAMERGYFREQGIEIDLTPFKTASDMTPAMVRGDLVMMGGGVSASFFNSIAQKMPLRYFVNRAQAPVWHSIVIRKDLADKVKSVKDLKGLRIATTAVGGLSEYELGKTLESAGLSLDDVDTRPLAMPNSVVAIQTGAVDAAVFVPPFDKAAINAGGVHLVYADEAVKPRMEVSGLFYNTDWAAKNKELLDRFTVAYIRGARCYLEAAHNGPNRNEVIDYFLKYSPVKDRTVFAETKWQDVNPDGRVMIDSLLDQQDFYARRGYVKAKMLASDMVDEGPVLRALDKLGTYQAK
jgi:NitT/TauT family transport system substrate-binding protein